MLKIIVKLSALFSLVFTLQSCAKVNTVKQKPFYGQKINAKAALPLDTVIRNHAKYDGKEVVMEADVEKVCGKKGCWMTLQATDKTFRVKFHDYSYFVPMALIGKRVWVQGQILKKEVSVADTRHYLADAGASKDKVAAVISPSFEYRIIAKGVKVVQ